MFSLHGIIAGLPLQREHTLTTRKRKEEIHRNRESLVQWMDNIMKRPPMSRCSRLIVKNELHYDLSV